MKRTAVTPQPNKSGTKRLLEGSAIHAATSPAVESKPKSTVSLTNILHGKRGLRESVALVGVTSSGKYPCSMYLSTSSATVGMEHTVPRRAVSIRQDNYARRREAWQ